MATFAGQATVAAWLSTDGGTVSRHIFRASVLASGNHPEVRGTAPGGVVAGSNQPFDLAAGASLRVASAFGNGPNLPSGPNAGDILCRVKLCNEAGTVIRSVDVVTLAGGWTTNTLNQGTPVTFYATSDGTATGTPKAGTYQLAVEMRYAQSTPDGVNGGYIVDTLGTDSRTGTPNTWNAAGSSPVKDKGYLRASTTVTLAVSGSGIRSYGESITLSADLADALLQASTLTLALGPSSGVSNSTTDNHARTVTVDNVFAASSNNLTVAVTAPNSPLSGIAEVVFTSTTADTVTVDPRLTIQLYMQLNTTALNTPPDGVTDVTHNVIAKLASDIGLVAIRVKNAKDNGVNGITFTTGSITAVDRNLLTAPIVRAGNNFTTSTLNGAAGWVTASSGLGGANPNFLSWAASQPGGTWDFAYTISGPAGATGLATPASPQSLIMLSANPNVRLVIEAGPDEANKADHFSPGDPLHIIFTMDNLLSHTFSLPTSPSIGLRRYNAALDRFEYLRATDLTWQPTGSAAISDSVFTTTTSPALVVSTDGIGYQISFSAAQTASWDYYDLVIIVVGSDATGTPYSAMYTVPTVGNFNEHSSYVFDPIGLFK